MPRRIERTPRNVTAKGYIIILVADETSRIPHYVGDRYIDEDLVQMWDWVSSPLEAHRFTSKTGARRFLRNEGRDSVHPCGNKETPKRFRIAPIEVTLKIA